MGAGCEPAERARGLVAACMQLQRTADVAPSRASSLGLLQGAAETAQVHEGWVDACQRRRGLRPELVRRHRTAVDAQLIYVHAVLALISRERVTADVQRVVVLHNGAVRPQGRVKHPVHVEQQAFALPVVHEGDMYPVARRKARRRVHVLAVAPARCRGGQGRPQLPSLVVEENGGRVGKLLLPGQVDPFAQQRAARGSVIC
mmetsp:Transcript_81933/g.240521  ORF Transcript_81933/g.240521 Transcript_81933/m.240521 type:complete len:202 (+) Transcript_81933:94-699(+)